MSAQLDAWASLADTDLSETNSSGDGAAAADVAAKPARERLMEAAARLFSEKDVGGVSVREICAAAGTGINMVHHYFGSKDGLLEEIIAQFDVSAYETPLRLLQTPARSVDDLSVRLELVFTTTLEATARQRDVLLISLKVQRDMATLVAFQDAFVTFMQHAIDDGLVRPALDPEMVSGVMLDRIINQVAYADWIREIKGLDIIGDEVYRQRWCRANVDLLLHGVLTT